MKLFINSGIAVLLSTAFCISTIAGEVDLRERRKGIGALKGDETAMSIDTENNSKGTKQTDAAHFDVFSDAFSVESADSPQDKRQKAYSKPPLGRSPVKQSSVDESDKSDDEEDERVIALMQEIEGLLRENNQLRKELIAEKGLDTTDKRQSQKNDKATTEG